MGVGMSAHTKGPWHTGQGNGEGSIFADEGRMRFENGTVLYPICTINTGWDAAEDAANTRLVAAAPVMLAALKDAERLLNIWLANNTDELFEEQSEIDDVRCLLSDTIELAEGSDQ